jgi:hypothetical protein
MTSKTYAERNTMNLVKMYIVKEKTKIIPYSYLLHRIVQKNKFKRIG